MRAVLLALALAAAGCGKAPCTLATDGGCPTVAECADAGVGGACPLDGLTCGCCEAGAASCELLSCVVLPDAGLAFEARSVTPPAACP